MHKISVLAVGPGSPEYLPPAVVGKVKECDLLVGGKRNLALFDLQGREKIEIKGKLDPLLAEIKREMVNRKIGILVSGDTGIYSILPRLVREFGRAALDVYPGISAVQYMFARLGLCWQDARFLSLHGRELDDLAAEVEGEGIVAIFTDKKHSPAVVCRTLAEAGLKDKKVYIGEDLSYPTEKISEGRAEDFTAHSGSDLNLVVICSE